MKRIRELEVEAGLYCVSLGFHVCLFCFIPPSSYSWAFFRYCLNYPEIVGILALTTSSFHPLKLKCHVDGLSSFVFYLDRKPKLFHSSIKLLVTDVDGLPWSAYLVQQRVISVRSFVSETMCGCMHDRWHFNTRNWSICKSVSEDHINPYSTLTHHPFHLPLVDFLIKVYPLLTFDWNPRESFYHLVSESLEGSVFISIIHHYRLSIFYKKSSTTNQEIIPSEANQDMQLHHLS